MGKNEKNIMLAVAFLIIIAIAIFGGFFIGSNKSNNSKCEPINCEENKLMTETFYAKITNILSNDIEVEGLDVNDISYRDNFTLNVTQDTNYEWRNETVKLTDLKIDDIISITFSKQKINSNVINEIVKIQILNDRIEEERKNKCIESILGGYITTEKVVPYEVELNKIIDVDIKNVDYSKIAMNELSDMYAIIKTSDNQIISKFKSYLDKNYSGYKKVQIDDYYVYVYNHVSNGAIELYNDINTCFE